MISESGAVWHRWPWLLFAIVFLLFLTTIQSVEVLAGESVAPDRDLIDGAGTEPSDWLRVSAGYLIPAQAEESFQWIHPLEGPSELRLSSSKRDIIWWERKVSLEPGLYHLTGEIQEKGLTPNLDSAIIGLRLSDNTFGISESSQSQPSGWQNGGLYFKVGKNSGKVDITCKLEGRGTVSCRHIILAKLAAPAPSGINVIDLDKYPEEQHAQKPRPYGEPGGQIWTLFLTILVLITIILYGWIAVGPQHE
jgi:hypothetical protein